MAKTPSAVADISVTKLSTPRIFLVRMLVFLILCGLIGFVLYKQIWQAFLANPGLNALIGAVLAMGGRLAPRFGAWDTCKKLHVSGSVHSLGGR